MLPYPNSSSFILFTSFKLLTICPFEYLKSATSSSKYFITSSTPLFTSITPSIAITIAKISINFAKYEIDFPTPSSANVWYFSSFVIEYHTFLKKFIFVVFNSLFSCSFIFLLDVAIFAYIDSFLVFSTFVV